mgnify:CR=1 FL=1|tara:strand:+ start:1219 stop:1623 length:405 start_codon:yes stop_codon:yes gene_type:complete
MLISNKLLIKIINTSYFKLLIVSVICFLIDYIIFILTLNIIGIIYANLISTSIAVIIDHALAKIFIFKTYYKLYHFIKSLFAFILFNLIVSFGIAKLILLLQDYINPEYSKLLLAPLSFTCFWAFYKIQKKFLL